MPPQFALTLSSDVQGDLLSVVKTLFIVFVAISFVCVAGYVCWQISIGKLLASENAPIPLRMQPAFAGWMFIGGVVGLIYLQSVLFPLLIMMGTILALVQNGQTAEIQFGFNRLPIIRTVAYALLVFGFVMLVEAPLTNGSDWVLDQFHRLHPEQQSVQAFRQISDTSTLLQFMFLAVVFNPIIEEIFFRGFLLTFLRNYMPALAAIVLSSAVFALAHLNVGAALPLWFLGIVLGIAYEHTGSLLVPICIHGCFNLATGLILLIEKGSSS